MDLSYLLVTLSVATAAIAILLGMVIVREGPRQRLNWLTAAMLFCGGAGALLGAADFVIALREAKVLRAQGGLVRNFAFIWEFFFPTFLLFTLYFPGERRVVRRFPWLGWVIFVPYVFHFVLLLLGAPSQGRFDFSGLSERSPSLGPVADFLSLAIYLLYRLNAALFPLVNLAATLTGIGLLFAAHRSAQNPRLRVQIRAVLAGLGGCLFCYALAVPLPVLLGRELSPLVRSTLIVVGLTLGSLSIAYAIVRHRFLDTQMLARRSILYGAATAIILGLYIALVRRVHMALAGLFGIDAEFVETGVLVVALLLFQPVLGRLEDWLESILIRDRADYRHMLRTLARDVTSVLDLGDLGRKMGDMLGTGLLVESSHLFVRTNPTAAFEQVASFGPLALTPRLVIDLESRLVESPPTELIPVDELLAGSPEVPPARLLLVPLRHGTDLLGMLLLGSKLTGGGFNAEDRALLTTLGDQIGVAIKNSHLHRESLQKSAPRGGAELRAERPAKLPARSFPAHGTARCLGAEHPVQGGERRLLRRGPARRRRVLDRDRGRVGEGGPGGAPHVDAARGAADPGPPSCVAGADDGLAEPAHSRVDERPRVRHVVHCSHRPRPDALELLERRPQSAASAP